MRKHYDFSKARRAKDVPALARLQAEAAEPTTFEVLDHFEIAGRGVVIFGRILSGVFRVGFIVSPTSTSPS
ncbi:MAG TPA: hypothetical protein VFA75_07905 [Nevskia sp.]|nr:hypothetical protein [Nevskia sp.]